MSHPGPRRRLDRRSTASLIVLLVVVAGLGVVGMRAVSGPGPVRPTNGGIVTGASGRPSQSAVMSPSPSTPASAAAESPPASSESPAPLPISDRGYLVSLAELRTRAVQAAAGHQPEAAAMADLLAWARAAVNRHPRPVDPLRITGTTGRFVDDTATAYGLALAWGVSGDPAFAMASRSFVMAWVAKTHTLQNACPDRGDCQTSLIVSRTAPGFVFAIDLLTTSGAVSSTDRAAFSQWLRTVILPAASTRPNNWGDAGIFLRVVATDFLADSAGFAAAIGAWRTQLDLVARDGHIPEEVRRGSAGLSYSQEALLYKLAVARIAERRGIDLWDARGALGGTLLGAVDLLARSLAHPRHWPWARGVTVPDPSPGWELAFAHWHDPAFVPILGPGRPYGSVGHSAIRWTTLTNGVPLGG